MARPEDQKGNPMFVSAQMQRRVRPRVGAAVGTAKHPADPLQLYQYSERNGVMNRIIWLVGAVVIVLFVLGYFGLR